MLGRLMSQMAIVQEKQIHAQNKMQDAKSDVERTEASHSEAFLGGFSAGLESALRLMFGTILDVDDFLRQAEIDPIGKVILDEILDPDDD